MRFGVREICDVVFKALDTGMLGKNEVRKGQPVLFIDSAKTSTVEGAATTVYATGGRGNSNLIAWEGEKTLTFTVEDALLSPIGFSILSGAGLFDASEEKPAYVHVTSIKSVDSNGIVEIELEKNETYAGNAPIFVLEYEHNSIGKMVTITNVTNDTDEGNKLSFSVSGTEAKQVFVDYYVQRKAAVTELTIDAENFAGYYYVEASTLFRREEDGKDLPAELVFPKVKIQSNFTFAMASTGDPSTFTFTMDALPGYTMFNREKKVLCAMQIIDDTVSNKENEAVTLAESDYEAAESKDDSDTTPDKE